MDKTFAFTLDDKIPVNPSNKFELWRGDNVVFNFTFKNGSDDLDVPANTTLRIFAKKIGANGLVNKADTPLFAGDFSTPTTASFSSTQTAGDAGNYLLAVLLMSSDSEVITAQGIYFELKENGYAGIYQPSEDFRDEVLDALEKALAAAAAASSSATQSADSATASANSANAAALSANAAKQSADSANAADNETATMLALTQEAQAKAAASATASAQSATTAQAAQAAAELAKNQAAEIVDPDNRIGQLFQTKLDKGVLYCNGGYAKVPQGAFTSLSKATMLIRFARDGATLTAEESLCNLGDGGTASTGISVRLTAAKKMNVLCLFKRADGTYNANGSHVPSFDVSGYLDGKMHSLAVCWSGTKTRVFIDGELKGQSATLESGLSILTSTLGITVGVRYAALASAPLYFRGQVSDFAVLNYDASEVDSNGNYTSAYSIADYQNGAEIPPWTVPIVFGNGKSPSANTTNAACVWSGANWSMTQTSNAATIKSMLYYIPLNIGQKLRIKFSNLTGGVLVDGKYGFFQPVRQESDQINVSTTSLDAEFTAATPITLWRFQFNCEAVDDAADRVPTVFENFVVERDGAIVALENYTIARNTTTKLIKDASGNGQDATVSGVLSGDRDNAVAAFVDELKTQINQQA